jgi:hypothetical protein
MNMSLLLQKEKRISNGETIQMMIAEAERSSVSNRFLDVLKGIQAQGDEKVKLMCQLVKDQKPSGEN